MKSVMYEWKKFRAFRYFWFLCSVFFLFNIWTLSEKMKMEMYDAGAVKQIYADLKAQPEEKRKERIEKLPEKKVPVYTGNEYAEEMLYNKIFQEYRQVNRYDKYLEEIKEKSASMSSAIFSNEGTFAYRNAQITPDAYEKLKGLKLKSDVSFAEILLSRERLCDRGKADSGGMCDGAARSSVLRSRLSLCVAEIWLW